MLAGHQVDAAVRARAAVRPVAPHPHVVEALGVARIRKKELAHQALEACALAPLRLCLEEQVVQNLCDARLTHGEKHTVRKSRCCRGAEVRDGSAQREVELPLAGKGRNPHPV